jgi:o-succinylbenzoate synthase
MNQALPSATPAQAAAVSIRRTWWQPFRVPFRSAFVTSGETIAAREGLIVGVETESGLVGLGEASPLPRYNGGSVTETAEAVSSLARGIVHLTPTEAWERDFALTGVSRGSAAAARCGVETALADLAAQAARLPLASWLAGWAGVPADALAARIPVNGTIDASDPKTAAREATNLVRRGFATLKLKVVLGDDADMERVAAIRSAVGPEVTLRIDPNGAWTEPRARNLLPRFAALGVALCEQPTSATGPNPIETLAAVHASSPIAIAADESCRTIEDLQAILDAGAADAVVIKPMASGLREAAVMVTLAGEARLQVIVTTMFDTGVGTVAAMHLAALAGNAPPACGLATLPLLEDDLITGGPRVARGWLRLPSRPGLGVRLDEHALSRYAAGPRGEV